MATRWLPEWDILPLFQLIVIQWFAKLWCKQGYYFGGAKEGFWKELIRNKEVAFNLHLSGNGLRVRGEDVMWAKILKEIQHAQKSFQNFIVLAFYHCDNIPKTNNLEDEMFTVHSFSSQFQRFWSMVGCFPCFGPDVRHNMWQKSVVEGESCSPYSR